MCKDNNEKRNVTIDFLYLDLTTCTRCQGTETNLEEALKDVSNVLEMAGYNLTVNKININTEELALKYKFLTSPTIRVNGHDIQMDFKETLCESCGDVCGDEVDCRVWIYQGKEYTEPPKAMIIDGILKEVYGNQKSTEAEGSYKLPVNLKKFYKAVNKKQSSCCGDSNNNCCC